MTTGRKRIAAALTTLCLGAVGSTVLTVSPSVADPDIDTVRGRVDRLYREAEQASERFNAARIERQDAERRLDRIQDQLDEQREQVEEVRDVVAASVMASYQGETLTATSRLLLADDPDAFITQMTTISEYTSRQAGFVEELAVEVEELEEREERAERQADRVERAEKVLAEEKAVIDEKAEKAERLLSRLEAEERERQRELERRERERQQRISRSADRATASAPSAAGDAAGSAVTGSEAASGSAAAAVQFALAQVGKAYVYGAAGPSAFDCSGLTMRAWGAAGVGLPHSSGAQMGSGTPVSANALRPGDLVFYYSPVSHVGIYAGNGMVVHAANPSTGVRMDPVMSMPFSGAVRPG